MLGLESGLVSGSGLGLDVSITVSGCDKVRVRYG